MDNSAPDITRTTHLFFSLLVVLCLSFGLWAYQGRLDVVSMAQGLVIPSTQVKQIQHFEGGIIRRINIKEGDPVTTGQALIELEQLRSGASLEELTMRVNALKVDVFRLSAQVETRPEIEFPSQIINDLPGLVREARSLFNANKKSHQSTVNKLATMVRQKQERIKTIKAQLENKRARLPLLEEELALSLELLADNLTTRIKHIEIMRRTNEIQGKIMADQSALKEAEHALIETREKLNEARNRFREESEEKLKTAKQELKEFSIRIKKFRDSLERTIIRSPINGVIKRLYKVTRGGVVKPGDTLADIVPSMDRLVIEAHLDISDIGYIKPGQRVFLQLPNKDAKKFNKLEGRVTQISPDTFTDAQSRTFYNVRIESDQSYFQAGDQKYRLYPGMVVMAYIHIGKRTILDYLMDPFINTLSFSLQER
ncbi:MAG: HlyD family type I secretion periplasmic adaptor subunit [Desulfobacter sp.]|nr:MAG: HlyD family type I secretion periplasmic adaptor subunit [Desulfobacter sp.]